MGTGLEGIAAKSCESNSEERSAGNLHATFCGGWGINWVPLLPGTGGEIPPVYPAGQLKPEAASPARRGHKRKAIRLCQPGFYRP
jgi:hypothetical protein